jgi:general secretion pathway protein M
MIRKWRSNVWFHRVVFIAANLAAAVVVVGLAIVIWEFFVDRDREIVEQRALLDRLKAMVAQESRIRATARDVEAKLQGGEFLHGANDGVVNADLQTRIKGIAEAAGARVRSVQTLPAKNVAKVRYIAARIDVYGPLQSIHGTVHAVESGKPLLFITAASIKPLAAINRPGGAQEPILQAQFDVVGAAPTDEPDK